MKHRKVARLLVGALVVGGLSSGTVGTQLSISDPFQLGSVCRVQAEPNSYYGVYKVLENLNLRDAPDGEYIKTYLAGTELSINAVDGNWVRVSDGSGGSEGWVCSDYLEAVTGYEYPERSIGFGLDYSQKVEAFEQEYQEALIKYQSDNLFVTCNSYQLEEGFYYLTHIIVNNDGVGVGYFGSGLYAWKPSTGIGIAELEELRSFGDDEVVCGTDDTGSAENSEWSGVTEAVGNIEGFGATTTGIQAGLSNGEYGGTRQTVSEFSSDVDAVVTVNGSCFSYDQGIPAGSCYIYDGEVLQDGVTSGTEVCLDSTGRLYSPSEGISAEALVSAGVRYMWCADSESLIQNSVLTKYDHTSREPRTVIGMVEPGEYYIVTAGKTDYLDGITEMAAQNILSRVGCTYAHFLDGGGSTALVINGVLINKPANGEERAVADFLYFKG